MEPLHLEDYETVQLPGGGGGGQRGGKSGVRWRDVELRRAIRQQDAGALLSTALALAALGIWSAFTSVTDRPFDVYDATISYPYKPSSIPYWCVVVAGLAAMALSAAAGECWLGSWAYAADPTSAVAAALHFWLECVSAVALTALTTSISKEVVGRLRPNFLALCKPDMPAPGELQVAYGQPGVGGVRGGGGRRGVGIVTNPCPHPPQPRPTRRARSRRAPTLTTPTLASPRATPPPPLLSACSHLPTAYGRWGHGASLPLLSCRCSCRCCSRRHALLAPPPPPSLALHAERAPAPPQKSSRWDFGGGWARTAPTPPASSGRSRSLGLLGLSG